MAQSGGKRTPTSMSVIMTIDLRDKEEDPVEEIENNYLLTTDTDEAYK